MSIDKLFNPETVAIIGASREEGKVGHTVLRNFVEGGFSGEVYGVNPKTDKVLGKKCYDSIKDIPEKIDHAIISVPPKVANKVVEQAVKEEIPFVTLITAGYKEIGEKGEKREEELKEKLEGEDTRLLGPNCLGVWDAYSKVDTLFLPDYKLERPPKGSIAIISQSGSFGSSTLDKAAEIGIGVSRFVSYGNQADITETDLLEWLAEDEETEAIAAYIEGVKDGRKFYEKAKELAEEKPIIVFKAGKSESGSDAASSHTGSLAGSYQVYQGAFKQSGVVEAGDVEEFFDITRELAYENPPEGNKVAVITNGGGYGVSAADHIDESDLEVAEFTEETKEKLKDILPDYGSPNNPIDVIGDADAERYEKALEIVSEDPNVDMLMPIVLLQTITMDSGIVEVLKEFNNELDKPLAASMVGGDYTNLHLQNLEHNQVPTFRTPKRAVKALEGLYQYKERNK